MWPCLFSDVTDTGQSFLAWPLHPREEVKIGTKRPGRILPFLFNYLLLNVAKQVSCDIVLLIAS